MAAAEVYARSTHGRGREKTDGGDKHIALARGAAAEGMVLQIYAQPPQGKLGKANRVLIGFAKTRLLKPGEAETLDVPVPAERLASYDDTGTVCLSACAWRKP